MNLKEEPEQKRCCIENMTEQDLTLTYERLANNGFPTKETLSFCYEIGRSGQVAYHYKLIVEDWQRSTAKRLRLETWFELHGKDGVDFLFDVLAHEPENMSAAYLLAGTLEKLSHQIFYTESCCKLTEHLEKRLPISDATERRMGIIALGGGCKCKIVTDIASSLIIRQRCPLPNLGGFFLDANVVSPGAKGNHLQAVSVCTS